MELKCANVECEDVTEERHSPLEIGTRIWQPKMGDGHVIVREVECSEQAGFHCGYCGHYSGIPHKWLVCECGELDVGDHHWYILP